MSKSLLNAIGQSSASEGPSVSPYERLPSELWSTIFIHCLPFPPSSYVVLEDSQEAPRDLRLSPLIISSVCRSWRNTACGTPELWESCWVNLRHPELNGIWLRRAGKRGLHLYVWPSGYLGEDFDWGAVFYSILPFQRRWKLIDLEMTNWGRPEVFESLDFDCPILETFRLTRYGGVPSWMEGLLRSAPRLRRFQLDNLWSTSPSSVVHLAFPLLLTLEVFWTTVQEVIEALSAFPNLQYLTILPCQLDTTIPPEFPISRHANLLGLQLDGTLDISIILDNLILPSLTKLHLKQCFRGTAFRNLVDRSRCHITDLSIGRFSLSDEELITALRDSSAHLWIKRLEFLNVENCLTPDLLSFLAYSETTQYFPHLTHLSFARCNFTNVPDGLVATTIISRCFLQVCWCTECLRKPQEIEAGLRYVSIDHLGRAKHSLDIAQLVPLPGDMETNKHDTAMFLGLVLMDLVPYTDFFGPGEHQSLYPIKFWLGGRDGGVSLADDL